ncbi:hypothetical protein EF908_14050 [Streptomyces sp. WAC04770]|nr:lyase family protein [Streptomyces sp. WAC04770]RST22889.1 hypothetical protein EF908_14050 [Streptomyces sp. WAC04770]
MSHHTPFSLLTHIAGDEQQLAIFSEHATIESWLAAERALAQAQARLGVIPEADAEAIAQAARIDAIDTSKLWATARTVGYPILGLVRQITALLPPGPDGHVHYGATTQDIMDTGLALQLRRSLTALDHRLGNLGDAIATKATEHIRTVMAARTHAQQAVPTTFGATLATLLTQITRQRDRLAQAEPRIARIALFGAGGTSAALGPHAAQIRSTAATLLDLHNTTIPWHAERDSLAEFGWLCATITATCAKLARNEPFPTSR